MKKLADFLVNRNRIIFTIFLALTAVILILLILPGTLALFDRIVCKKGQRMVEEKDSEERKER